MKKLSTLCFAFWLVVTLIAPAVRANDGKDQRVTDVLARMEKSQRSLRTLRGNIEMEKYNSQVRESDKSYGTLAYASKGNRNASVRVEWQRPQQEILVSESGKYQLYRPRLNTVMVGNANQNRSKVNNMLGFGLNMSKAEIESRFDVKWLGEGTLYGNVHVNQLQLTPKTAASYKQAEIWVDDAGLPTQTRWIEKNNDWTTVRITDAQRNVSIPSDAFRLQLPSGVKKIQA